LNFEFVKKQTPVFVIQYQVTLFGCGYAALWSFLWKKVRKGWRWEKTGCEVFRRVTPIALRDPSVTLLNIIAHESMHLNINKKWSW